MAKDEEKNDPSPSAEPAPGDLVRRKRFQSRSELSLVVLWSILGLAVIWHWDGFGLPWLAAFVLAGLVAGIVHRSVWIGIFAFLGMALACTLIVGVGLIVIELS